MPPTTASVTSKTIFSDGRAASFCAAITIPLARMEIRGERLSVEWKSGDYSYGGMEPKYYVFERE